jgi:hypothetical protein
MTGDYVYVYEGEVKRVKESTGAKIYGVKFTRLGFISKLRLRKIIYLITNQL